MSNIPLAREKIETLQAQLQAFAKKLPRKSQPLFDGIDADLTDILAMMTREKPGHKPARREARKVTRQVVIDVLKHKAAHPKASHWTIARKFRINPGRVSEILAGKRDHLLPDAEIVRLMIPVPQVGGMKAAAFGC